MTVSLTLEQVLQNILETKFFKNLYHSVSMQPRLEGGSVSPAAQIGNRFVYVGPDDTKGFNGYIRQTGAAEVVKKEPVSCGVTRYQMKFPFRAVFFNDKETRNFEDLTAALTKAIIKTARVELIRINPIREEVLRTEVPAGKFKFKTSTYYVSIDFFVFLALQADNCEQVLSCSDLVNPYCSPV